MANLSELLPELEPYARYLVVQFPRLTITSVYRSYTEQLQLYRNRARNPFPVAPPGRSYHGYRRAWDMVGPSDELAAAGELWERMGGTWGGHLKPRPDPIHFQA